jgi:ATP-dependent protease ClpP protease subunit
MSKDNILSQVHNENIDMRRRIIWVHGSVDETTFEKFSKNMHMLEQTSGEITIKFCSEGGHVSYGWGIYDLILLSKNYVKVIVESKCESMATVILQAADERVMLPNSRMMIHVGTEEYAEQHPEDIKRWKEWSEKDETKTEDIYLKRIKEKKPRYTRKQLQNMLTFDTILNPKQAIELGLADKVYGDG